MLSLLDLFCEIDDFCQEFLPELRKYQVTSSRSRQRKRSLCQSEIITILIAFQLSHYREFKNFYLTLQKKDFPGLVSYNRFIEYIPSVLIIMISYVNRRNGKCTGVSFVDSTKLVVCHNKRIHNHKVFKDQAKRGKTSTGCFLDLSFISSSMMKGKSYLWQ